MENRRQNGHIFEFGEFRLIPDEGLLLRRGDAVPLTPKVFSTLVALVERHGSLVERSELIDRVWSDSFVEESAVSRCVWTLRNALEEKATGEKYIQTVPKRGYRFVGEVRTRSTENTDIPHEITLDAAKEDSGILSDGNSIAFGSVNDHTDAVTEHTSEPNELEAGNEPSDFAVSAGVSASKTSNRFYTAAGVLLVSLIAFGAIFYFFSSASASVSGTGVQRLAVLPLKPVDESKRDRTLEFAIADALILKLSESKEFEVKRLNTVRKFVDLETDPIDAGVELGVDYVLASNYQITDGQIRVTSQLINVKTGSTDQIFRSESVADRLFKAQDAIADDIGNKVLTQFGKPTGIFAARRGTENEEAYGLYQQAWYLIDKGTAEESEKAAKLLDRAVELDPNYAQAWAVRSHAYCQFAHLGGDEPLSVFATAEPMLEQAMSIDPNNAVAYTIRGTINRDFHWNFPEAIANLKKAIEIDPSLVLAHRILAGVYYRNGQFDEAIESEKRAVDLHPTSLVDHRYLGLYLVAAGRKTEGVAQLDRVVEMDPKSPAVYAALWEVHHLEGNHQKAYENFIKMKELYGIPADDIALYARAYKASGWRGVLRAELDWTLSKEPKGRYCNYKYYIASLAALLGDADLSFYYLEEAIRYRLISVSFLKVDPKFAALRNDPRYAAIVERIGLVNKS